MKLRVYIILLMLVFVLGACKNNNLTKEKISQLEKEEIYPEPAGMLESEYEKLKDIIKDSETIVKASAISNKKIVLDGYPQIHTNVTIKDVLKGDLTKGDNITIVEEAGSDGKVVGEIPILSSNNDYFLFLKEYKNNYYIVGAFQGRFIVKENYVFQQTSENIKLEDYSPMDYNDFKNLIISNLK
ncbi:hypothetical protein [Helcococcus kunzii]|uniref:hypothetical protein n=1 Tax=Helcococcus kunzii TaxID=40091 RepID=UPI0024ADF4B0|nr:hypothetical protein [Helcococcus kunzii]